MKLYLSSFRNGNKPEELLKLLGSGRRTALILNAMDSADAEYRKGDYEREAERLHSIGLEPEEVDLRDYFGKASELQDKLTGFDLIWVRGGNVFVLRRAFNQSGADNVIAELVKSEAVVYGGYSAGIDMIQPHLHGVELVDDPSVVPEGYDKEIIWDCLGFIPYCIAEHYKSDHPESAAIDKTVEYYIENHIPFVALHDGEAIVIDGDEQHFVG
jgi:dipeptidase E